MSPGQPQGRENTASSTPLRKKRQQRSVLIGVLSLINILVDILLIECGGVRKIVIHCGSNLIHDNNTERVGVRQPLQRLRQLEIYFTSVDHIIRILCVIFCSNNPGKAEIENKVMRGKKEEGGRSGEETPINNNKLDIIFCTHLWNLFGLQVVRTGRSFDPPEKSEDLQC
jgi:hypothetical protein